MLKSSPIPAALRVALGLAALAVFATGPPARGASSAFDDCEAAFAADPQGWATCGCFHRVANGTALQDEAVARLEAHRATDPTNPCLAFTLARLLLENVDAQGAAPLFEEAAEEYRARGLADGEVYARINLSQALSAMGADGTRVTAQLELSRQAAEGAENPILAAEVTVKEAKLLLRRGGDLDLAEASLRQVRRDIFPLAHASLQRDILFNMGTVLFRRGRFVEAEEVFAQLAELTAAAGLRLDEASARVSRAAAAGAGLPDTARRERVVLLLEEALVAAQEAGNPVAEIETRSRLGRLIGGPEGRAHLEVALALAEPFRDRLPDLLAGVLSASAMDLLPDDPTEARRRVDEAFTLLLGTTDPWRQASGWANRLRVLWATAPRDEALSAALSTLEIADRLGQLQETEGGRAEVASVWTEIYQWLAGRLLTDAVAGGGEPLDPETLATAFSVAERMRARLLLESLSAAGVKTAGAPGEIDPELEASWRALQQEIVSVHRRLLDPRLPSERRRELLPELDALEQEEERLDFQRNQLRSTATAGPEDVVGLDELRAGLAPNEALLAFQLAPWRALDGSFTGGSWLVAVTRNDVRVHRLPDQAAIDPVVDLYLDLFDRRDGSEAEPAAALYDLLLREALETLPAEVARLILVPNGSLYLLPFATLREAADGPPLVARYQLFLTPSATAWHRLRAAGQSGENALALALADPSTPGGAPAGESIAETERSWTAGVRLAALPYARREGRVALRSLGDPGRLLTGADATERAVKEGAGRGLRVLHFGTHAVLDEARPRRSAVVLAAGAPDEDGLLRPREAADLGLDGAIVVLAACQSASGTVLQGEGALSLARAFLQGGARAVVGSLWPVEDEEAAELLERFYRHLGRGDTVAGALARAQRETLRTGAPAAAWAGWTVLGDGEAVVVPGGRSPRVTARRLTVWLGGGLALALALLLAATLARRLHTAPGQ